MKAFLKWRCNHCNRGGQAASSKECVQCGQERASAAGGAPPAAAFASFAAPSPKRVAGSGGGEEVGSSAKRARVGSTSLGSLGAAMQVGKGGRPFAARFKSATLPGSWRAAYQGSVLFRGHALAKSADASGSGGGGLRVAAFDFDNTLVSHSFMESRNSSQPVSAKLMFDNVLTVLSRAHELGYRVVVISNEYLGRLKNPDPIRNAIARKTGRVDDFLALLGDVPVECYLATMKDKFRKASDKDVREGVPLSGALWDFMASDPCERLGPGAALPAPPKGESFFVGDAAGREGDLGGDADKNFAAAAGVRFFTPEEFFVPGSPGQELLGLFDAAGAAHERAAAAAALAAARQRLQEAVAAGAAGRPPLVVVMSGLPGSGKSTVARAILAALPGAAAVRVSQDVLKAAKKVEFTTRAALAGAADSPRVVIVDRTNSTVANRAALLGIAKEAGAASLVVCLAPGEVECKSRCLSRTDHDDPNFPTNKGGIAMIVGRLRNTAGKELLPTAAEGMDGLLVLDGVQSKELVEAAVADRIAQYFDPQPPGSAASSAVAAPAAAPAPASAEAPAPALPLYAFPSAPIAKVPGGNFRQALHHFCRDPPELQFQPWVFTRTRDFCVIYDAYPKAKVHLLLMFVTGPAASVDQLAELSPAHVPALERAHDWVTKQLLPHLGLAHSDVRFGFHAVPSLNRLHLHIISQDFDSPGLKNKKHWLSFTHGDYFIDLHKAVAALKDQTWTPETMPALKKRAGQLVAELLCHRCGVKCTSMPALKTHIASCGK